MNKKNVKITKRAYAFNVMEVLIMLKFQILLIPNYNSKMLNPQFEISYQIYLLN